MFLDDSDRLISLIPPDHPRRERIVARLEECRHFLVKVLRDVQYAGEECAGWSISKSARRAIEDIADMRINLGLHPGVVSHEHCDGTRITSWTDPSLGRRFRLTAPPGDHPYRITLEDEHPAPCCDGRPVQ